jgi:ATP-binding cassette subfamily B protein/subfamily B ATP-binding cassette protein MsbA
MKLTFVNNLKKNPLWLVFWNRKNIVLSFFVIFTNFLAALLEGISFGCILLALSSLSASTLDSSASPFLAKALNLFSSLHFSQKSLFVVCIVLAIVLQAFRSGISYLAQYITSKLSLKMQMDAQLQVYQQILHFSFPCVSQYKVGDLVKYAETPTMVMPQLLNMFNQVLLASGMIIVAIGMMLFLNASLTLIAFCSFGLFVFFQKLIVRRIAGLSKNLSEQIANFSKHAVQSLYGMRVIHTFQRQENVFQKIVGTLKEIVRSTQKINLWGNSIPAVNEMTGILLVGLLLITGSYLFSGNENNALAMLTTFLVVTYRLSTRIQVMMSGIGGIAYQFGHFIRLKEILDTRGKEFVRKGGKKFEEFNKSIEFCNISLSYYKNQKYAIKDFSFSFSKGQVVALVGSSGAGKSSLIDLLIELYEPTEGKILIDGENLKDYEVGSWREKLGVVSQDTFVFNESIEENIRFGKLEASLDQIIEAAKMAHAHEFISQLSQGYQTVVGERGYRLSGGERQRIALARIFLRDPEILILDEATSSLDSHSELLIQDALAVMFQKKKTVIMIAHRLSTILKADQILVLDKGRLIERGTHHQLLEKEGSYFHFWKLQSEYHKKPQEMNVIG